MDKIFISFLMFFLFVSCLDKKENNSDDNLFTEYKGWWIYGEGLHLFKDEISLDEYVVIFPNEDSIEIIDLYLSIAEMEYFPMDVQLNGNVSEDSLIVSDFEILYIQGCEEQ